MKPKDLKDLSAKTVSLLRMSEDAWDEIAETRRQGSRFSLHFPHEMARVGQRGGLVLISTKAPKHSLRVGVIGSIGATSTLDSRVVFDLVSPVLPGSLDRLLECVTQPRLKTPRARLSSSHARFERISLKLGKAMIAGIAAEQKNGPALARILAHLRQPSRYSNARALQQDAVALAIKAFGGSDEAVSIALPGDDTAIANVRLLEDAVIEHDARWMPGWRLADSALTGHATFEKRGERLDVFTANKRPLEKLFGVDLLYLNQARGALVMVQYKMLELGKRGSPKSEAHFAEDEDSDDDEWIARIDDQFDAEIKRMRRFDRDFSPNGPYRMNSGAFFFKLVRRNASTHTAGILLSLEHLDHMRNEEKLNGPGNGLRISYQDLAGHYLRGEGFIELVRSGYIGTRGATTDHLQALINASLKGGNAVVAGIQSALSPDHQ